MAISRLFFEIGGDSSRLNSALREAVKTAEEAGIKITRAGQAFVSKFDEALNPTKRLAEQIKVLEAAGKSEADIMKVMGDQIAEASRKAKDMGQPIDDLVRKYTSLESRLKTAGQELQSFGRSWSMYVTAPIVAVGAAAFKAADDYEKGIARIRVGTGATGDALRGLAKDMSAIWGTIPQGAEQIGTAVAELNTRLGLTGEPLQKMATQMLNLARITGSDVSQTVAAATRLFGDWSVSTSKQSDTLDMMFRVSQNTGIQMQKLLELTVQYGAPMRSLGFDLENAAAAMGKWEKEGVNMETVLSGLKMEHGAGRRGSRPSAGGHPERHQKRQDRIGGHDDRRESVRPARGHGSQQGHPGGPVRPC
jgi:phage-related minor tail protein